MKQEYGKKLIIEQLKKTPILEIALSKSDVSRTTFYRWQKTDPDFSAQVKDALFGGKELISDLAEGQLINAIKQGHVSALIFWLKTHRDDYKNRLEISGELKNIREELTAEELELLQEALRLFGFQEKNSDSDSKT